MADIVSLSPNPVKYELLALRDCLHGSAVPSGGENTHVAWPITTGAVSPPANRRAVLCARRIYLPNSATVRGLSWVNDGGINAATQSRRIKVALFYADGNTGHWEGTNGVSSGLPSIVHPDLQMANSIAVGDASTSGSAQNLFRGGASGSTRGMRIFFDREATISAGTWLWILVMCELMYDAADGSSAPVFPAASASEILTPHQQGAASNSRNLVWTSQIGDGSTRALDTADHSFTNWNNFENATVNWLNQTSTSFTLSSNGVNMVMRDFYGHLIVRPQ